MKVIKLIIHFIPLLLKALPLTADILVKSILLGLVVSMLLTIGRLGKNKFIQKIVAVYISFMRGTPLIIQIFLMFFGLPIILKSFGINTLSWDGMIYAVLTFGLNVAAFFSEILRSAYLAINKGQIEAAYSIGMSDFQVFRRVIVPQALASALPNITNMIIEVLKNTSLAVSIGVVDMMGKANQLAQASFGVGQLEVLLAVSLLYWFISLIMILISNKITIRLNKGNSNSTIGRKKTFLLGRM
jgi:His/Glu/Gln/Arg/opine family amino acid ABC transporter permease subunit